MPELKYIVSVLLAILPAIIWVIVFSKKHRTSTWSIFLTFIGGIFAAQLILLYKGYWDTSINLIFFKIDLVNFKSNISSMFVNTVLATGVTLLSVGAIEEFSKFILMRFLNKNHFKSIDDVISLAIVSALGFSFYENSLYFIQNWDRMTTASFVILVLSRVTIVSMVHMLCSGILGYYFALAHFASPVLRIQHYEKKHHPVLRFFKNVLHFSKTHLYRDEMMVIGLVLAMLLHAIYDFILSFAESLDSIVISLTIFFYFFGGYYFLSYLMKQKMSKMQLGLLVNQNDDE